MIRRILWVLSGALIVLLELGFATLDFIRDCKRRLFKGRKENGAVGAQNRLDPVIR
jgi:hypothetical protein